MVLVAGLLVAAAVLRAPALGPSSLWLDDAWPALVVHADSPSDVLLVGLTAPGFVAMLGALLAVAGTGALAAQALPFACGVLAVPGVYAVARQAGLARAAALLGAGVLLVAPVHLTYSARVKQYTLEGLLVLALAAAALAVSRRPERGGRWALLCGTAVVGTALSGVVAVPAVTALAAAGVAALRSGGRAVRGAAVAAGVWLTFAGVWWTAVVRPARNETLARDWSAYFSAAGLGDLLADLSSLPVAVAAVVAVLSAVAVLTRGPVLTLLLLGPPVLAVALAEARVAPLGGGRTDLYLYPSLALAVACGVDAAGRRVGRPAPARLLRPVGVPLALVGVAALAAAAPPPEPYPQEDVRPLVSRLEEGLREGDVVLVYSATRSAFAFATTWPVDLRASGESPNGFLAVPDPPPGVGLVVLPPQRETPERHRPVVTAAVAPAVRVWLLTSHTTADVAVVHDGLAGGGWHPVRRAARPGAELTLWERS